MEAAFHQDMTHPLYDESFTLNYQDGRLQQIKTFHPDDVRYMSGNSVSYSQEQYDVGQEIPIRGSRSHTASESSSSSPNYNNYSGSSNVSGGPRAHSTKLCQTFMAGKQCRYGSRCWYAHGHWELQRYDQSSDNNNYIYSLPPVPTTAQLEWVLRSQLAVTEAAHAGLILGNRTKVYSQQQRAPSPPKSQSSSLALLLNRPAAHQCPTPQHNFALGRGQPRQSKSLIELMMDINAPLLENDPESSMPFVMPDELDQFPPTAIPSGFLGFIKDHDGDKKSSDRCDIFSISGFCPLGDECNFQHSLTSPPYPVSTCNSPRSN